MTNQSPLGQEPDIEQAAIECWRQTRNDSVDWDWGRVTENRKGAYRRMAVAILSASGCLNGPGKSTMRTELKP